MLIVGSDMNGKLGFDVMQVLIQADSAEELNEAIRVINTSYPILLDRLAVIEEVKEYEKLGLRVGFIDLNKKEEE